MSYRTSSTNRILSSIHICRQAIECCVDLPCRCCRVVVVKLRVVVVVFLLPRIANGLVLFVRSPLEVDAGHLWRLMPGDLTAGLCLGWCCGEGSLGRSCVSRRKLRAYLSMESREDSEDRLM